MQGTLKARRVIVMGFFFEFSQPLSTVSAQALGGF
jgi:hypothetical protein